MDVVKDVLDAPVLDRNGREMGRVDGILIDAAAGRPPTLAAILIGPSALAHRVHPMLGRWMTAIERALGLADSRPVQISFDHITEIDRHVGVDLAITETSADAIEGLLRKLVVKIPERQ